MKFLLFKLILLSCLKSQIFLTDLDSNKTIWSVHNFITLGANYNFTDKTSELGILYQKTGGGGHMPQSHGYGVFIEIEKTRINPKLNAYFDGPLIGFGSDLIFKTQYNTLIFRPKIGFLCFYGFGFYYSYNLGINKKVTFLNNHLFTINFAFPVYNLGS